LVLLQQDLILAEEEKERRIDGKDGGDVLGDGG
jgi:hypothetical protein